MATTSALSYGVYFCSGPLGSSFIYKVIRADVERQE